MTYELDYVRGQETPDSTAKLSCSQPFEGAERIGGLDYYERIGAMADLEAICRKEAIIPFRFCVPEIKRAWAPKEATHA